MISKSSRWSNVRGMKNSGKPFLLQPAGKDYLWGGNRLNEEFSKNMPQFPLAETWECSTIRMVRARSQAVRRKGNISQTISGGIRNVWELIHGQKKNCRF